MTQSELADLINYNNGTISNIENSSYQTFSLDFLFIISNALDIPMEDSFKDIDKER